MAQSIFFHNAADQASVSALSGAFQHSALSVAAPVPGAVSFGARVVVVWSQHAAADYADMCPAVPENTVVVQLDETPLPPAWAGLKARVAVTGDWADDADRLAHILSGGLAAARPALTAPVARRSAPVARPVAAMRRRQAQSASMVTAAGAMGTLAAFALGAVVPAEQFVTPSFAAPNPMASPANAFERHEHLAQARQLTDGQAQFQGVTSATGAAVTFSAEEIAALNSQLGQSEQIMAGSRGWSDQAMARLQALSASAPDPMPAMAAIPQSEAPRMAAAPAAPLVSAEPAPQMVLRERFAQVEPVAYAVDRLGEVFAPAADAPAPIAVMPGRITDG